MILAQGIVELSKRRSNEPRWCGMPGLGGSALQHPQATSIRLLQDQTAVERETQGDL